MKSADDDARRREQTIRCLKSLRGINRRRRRRREKVQLLKGGKTTSLLHSTHSVGATWGYNSKGGEVHEPPAGLLGLQWLMLVCQPPPPLPHGHADIYIKDAVRHNSKKWELLLGGFEEWGGS